MSWNYTDLANQLAHCYNIDENAFSFMLEEARKRHDSDVLTKLASWFEATHDICQQSVDLYCEAAAMGSSEANFRIASEYRTGHFLKKDYEKAYSCYLKGEDCDWAPIDPEEDSYIMDEDGGGEVTADYLLSTVKDVNWWLFLLDKHPSRALKCGMADWYMQQYLQQGGEQKCEKALQLFQESAMAGFEFAFFKLIEFYASGDHKDLEKGRYWYRKAEEFDFDEACFASDLGIESLGFKKLKAAADEGDYIAAAKVACAYLHGDFGEYEPGKLVCCPKDEAKARHYGEFACADDEGISTLLDGLDSNNMTDMKFLCEVSGPDED